MAKKQTFGGLPADLYDNAAEAAQLLRTLSHPQRLCLLCHLTEQPRSVNELVELCGIGQSQISQFLMRMKLEGLVEADVSGRQRIYRLTDPKALATLQALTKIYCNQPKPTENRRMMTWQT